MPHFLLRIAPLGVLWMTGAALSLLTRPGRQPASADALISIFLWHVFPHACFSPGHRIVATFSANLIAPLGVRTKTAGRADKSSDFHEQAHVSVSVLGRGSRSLFSVSGSRCSALHLDSLFSVLRSQFSVFSHAFSLIFLCFPRFLPNSPAECLVMRPFSGSSC